MSCYIPFLMSANACTLASRLYHDAKVVRLPLDGYDKLRPCLSAQQQIWVDPCIDGLDDLNSRIPGFSRSTPWLDSIRSFPEYKSIANPDFQAKPDQSRVDAFADAVLNACEKLAPHWITIPQLPLVSDAARNKINRSLAKATAKWRQWRRGKSYRGQLILPIIFTKSEQTAKGRTPRLKNAVERYADAQADGFWVVDTSLNDEEGSVSLRNRRLSAALELHEELAQVMPSQAISIAGPYWALNIVLWARGLVQFPAIGVGTGYHYHLSGMRPDKPSARVALPPLRRRAVLSPQLNEWLGNVLAKPSDAHPQEASLKKIRDNFNNLQLQWREQVAGFYKEWVHSLLAIPSDSRPMALYKDLSDAYMNGKAMREPLPREEGATRRPEAIVEPLMLRCL
ncbi:MAG: hypothetical protein NTU53_13875 [Planctomycetota bacterium]|nr:hypothetical protein [Planctomycetota bacterium]